MDGATLLAAVPLTLGEKSVALSLAASMLAAAVMLLRRPRPAKEESHEKGEPVGPAAKSTEGPEHTFESPWRTRTGWALGICAVLVAAGTFVDPRVHPKGFVAIWLAVVVLVGLVLCATLFELVVVRGRMFGQRIHDLQEEHKELQRELRRSYRRHSQRGNGHPV